MDSATYPVTAAATADDLDDLLGVTGAGLARSLFHAQKSDLAVLLSRLRDAPLHAADRTAAAALLHKIAGTAAYFHDQPLGTLASAAAEMRDMDDRAAIVAWCDRLLLRLGAR